MTSRIHKEFSPTVGTLPMTECHEANTRAAITKSARNRILGDTVRKHLIMRVHLTCRSPLDSSKVDCESSLTHPDSMNLIFSALTSAKTACRFAGSLEGNLIFHSDVKGRDGRPCPRV